MAVKTQADDKKQALIDCFKDPGVTAVLRDEVLMPIVQKAVSDAVAAKDREIRQLKMELAKQRQDINDLEQYSRKNCLSITGLPEKPEESVSQTVVGLARAVGVDLLPTDIDVAHRIGNKNRSKTRPVIVKLTRFEKRQELYAARKRIRSSELAQGSPITAAEAANVFIADSLTKYNQGVMFAARQLKRKGKLFATWSDTGKLKVRVTSEAPTTIIRSLADLQKLVGDDPVLEPPPVTSVDAEPELAPAGRPDLSTAAAPERDGFQTAGRGRGGRKKK